MKKQKYHHVEGILKGEIKGEIRRDGDFLWQCNKCGGVIKTKEYQVIPIPPSECYEDEGGCGRESMFVNITNQIKHKKLEEENQKLKETLEQHKIPIKSMS